MMMLLRPSPAVVILCHALAAESLEVLMWLEACGRTRARHKVVHLVRRLIHSDFSLNVLAENVAPWEELPPVHVLDHRCILRVHSVVRLRLPALLPLLQSDLAVVDGVIVTLDSDNSRCQRLI